jgi:hypothetical protein
VSSLLLVLFTLPAVFGSSPKFGAKLHILVELSLGLLYVLLLYQSAPGVLVANILSVPVLLPLSEREWSSPLGPVLVTATALT